MLRDLVGKESHHVLTGDHCHWFQIRGRTAAKAGGILPRPAFGSSKRTDGMKCRVSLDSFALKWLKQLEA